MRGFFFILCLTSLLFTSCSLPGTQDESTTALTENTTLYETSAISILLPKTWTGVALSEISSPRVGEVVVASRSTDTKYGFASNILIMKNTLDTIVTSTKYSEINHLQTTKNYLEYTKMRDEAFEFSDSETSRLYVFEARYNETTPRMKFIQTARVCGSSVYLIHVSLTVDKSPDNYIELLKTFRCK